MTREGCDSSFVFQKSKKKTGFQNMVGTFEYEFFRGAVHFSEQRSVQSEQQNPVFRQNRVLTSNFARNEQFDRRKVL